ncbi:MAG: oxidoreductase [Actinomycetales bacterium mxb001]|nr:MAG: oxidoreductase [Actinomycetales bacterium mxb001]
MTFAPLVQMNDGRSIPVIGFGVWQVPDDVVIDATVKALEVGYRHIDTACVYENERGVGEALRRSGLDRDEVFITTKVWNTDQGYEQTLRAFDTSVGLLGIDEVDLYLVHWPTPARDLYLETWQALIRLREEGRARSIGVSNFHESHLRRIIDETGVIPAMNQIELHPWLPQTHLRDVDARLGIKTEAWSPLGSGQLIDDSVIGEIAAKHGKSSAQVMIRWSLQLGNIVLPKSVTPARIEQNIDVFDFELDDADMAAIATLESGRRTGPNPDEFNMA